MVKKDLIKTYADNLEKVAAHTLPYIRNPSIARRLKQAIMDYEKAKKLQEQENNGKTDRVHSDKAGKAEGNE